jgi:hypothetical protein
VLSCLWPVNFLSVGSVPVLALVEPKLKYRIVLIRVPLVFTVPAVLPRWSCST